MDDESDARVSVKNGFGVLPGQFFTLAAFIIIAGAAVYLFSGAFFGILGIAQASDCSFGNGINCDNLAIVSNSTETVFSMLGSNPQSHPISGVSLNVTIGGFSSEIKCVPEIIRPGQTFVCSSELSIYEKPGAAVSGNIAAYSGHCTNSDNCASAVPETYIAKFLAYAKSG